MLFFSFQGAIPSSFSLGSVVVTASISQLMQSDLSFHTFIYTSLMRHEGCDWGELEQSDIDANFVALQVGSRLFSVYQLAPIHQAYGSRVYIITEADRSVTTVLWPREY